MLCVVGVGALFGFDIEGDVGVDPNDMVLWFSQPRLGLPSKVNLYLLFFYSSSDSTIGILSRGSNSACIHASRGTASRRLGR